mgnify:CR=1 FL=1
MIRPTLEEAKTLAKEGNYQVLPVSMELYSDFVTPIEVLRKLQNVSSHCYLLESIEDSQKWGRYTFLGYQPKLELTCKDFNNTEKVAYLPRRLDTQGAPAGFDPQTGSFAYYAPWGNLAFFYRDYSYANSLIELGLSLIHI